MTGREFRREILHGEAILATTLMLGWLSAARAPKR